MKTYIYICMSFYKGNMAIFIIIYNMGNCLNFGSKPLVGLLNSSNTWQLGDDLCLSHLQESRIDIFILL